MTKLNIPIGTATVSAWQPVPGIVWIQTSSPKLALKLSKMEGAKRVAYSVSGGYLRTFEFKRQLAWAQDFIARNTVNETVANAPIRPQICPTSDENRRGAASARRCRSNRINANHGPDVTGSNLPTSAVKSRNAS